MNHLEETKLYNTDIVIKACNDAMNRKKMVGIVDYSGAGKSYALHKFKNENKGVFLIELGASVPPKEMYVEILNKIRNEDISRSESISNIKRRIRLELEEYSGGSLIIIDEASRYEREKVSYFHELRNMTQYHCGLIISGHEDYESHLLKWMSQGIPGVFEFKSRFSYFINLRRPTIPEIKAIFDTNKLLKNEPGRNLFNEICSCDMNVLDYRMIRNLIMERLNV